MAYPKLYGNFGNVLSVHKQNNENEKFPFGVISWQKQRVPWFGSPRNLEDRGFTELWLLHHGYHHVSKSKQAWIIHDGVKSTRIRRFSLFSFWLFPGFSQNYSSIHFSTLGTSLVLVLWILNQHQQHWDVFFPFSPFLSLHHSKQNMCSNFLLTRKILVWVCLSVHLLRMLQSCFNGGCWNEAEVRQLAQMPELFESQNWVNKPVYL